MAQVYRRCSECDYYTRDSIRKADRSLADHQRATGHQGEGRGHYRPTTPVTPPAETGTYQEDR